MSLIEPKIDQLLEETDNDRFLLCAIASRRAHDINDMLRGQRDRAMKLRVLQTKSRSLLRLTKYPRGKSPGILQPLTRRRTRSTPY